MFEGIPRSMKRSASSIDWAHIFAKDKNSFLEINEKRLYLLKDLLESLALIRTTGTLRLFISNKKFGHISDSTIITMAGSIFPVIYFTENSRSKGKKNIESTSFLKSLFAISNPVFVEAEKTIS
jgi:hypothetical protein